MKFYSPVKFVFLSFFLLPIFLYNISVGDNPINNKNTSTFHKVVLSVNDNCESNYAFIYTIFILRHKSVSISYIIISKFRCCSLTWLQDIQHLWNSLNAGISHLYIIRMNTNIKINKFPK